MIVIIRICLMCIDNIVFFWSLAHKINTEKIGLKDKVDTA